MQFLRLIVFPICFFFFPFVENENDLEKPNATTEKEPERKPLPDLDKYWKAVNDDPSDFTGWTYLLQYVEQEVNLQFYFELFFKENLFKNLFSFKNDIEAAREAYDAFLAHYPYCYGYWRKYADYEKRKGNKKKCEEVSLTMFLKFNVFHEIK